MYVAQAIRNQKTAPPAVWRQLAVQLKEGEAVLGQIEACIDGLWEGGQGEAGKDLSKRRRMAWLSSATKISKLRNQLVSILSATSRLLIALNVSVSADMQVTLQRSYEDIQDHIDLSLRGSEARLASVLTLSHQAIISHMDNRLGRLGAMESAGPHSRPATPRTPLVHEPGLTGCGAGCLCKCHKAGRYSLSVRSLRPIIGSIVCSYTGRASTPACTDTGCWYFSRGDRQRNRPSEVRVTYHFPTWLVRASLSALYSSNLNGSPQLVLRVTVHLPREAIHPQTLFYLTLHGDVDGVKKVLSEGGEGLNSTVGRYRLTPLMMAVSYGHAAITQLLLQAGADPHCGSEGEAVSRMVNWAIDCYLLSDSKSAMNEAISYLPFDEYIEECELTPLHKIVMGLLNVDLAEALRKPQHLADINKQSLNALTSLIIAVKRHDVKATRLLIRAGADVNMQSSSGGMPAISWLGADSEMDYQLAKLLLDAGASPNIPDEHGQPALLHAVQQITAEPGRHGKFIKLLLKHGADPNSVDEFGNNALFLTGQAVGIARAKILIDHGLDINHRDNQGETALTNAIIYNRPDMAAFLLDEGIDLTGVNKNGRGVLHSIAAQTGIETVKVFMERAAKLRGVLKTSEKDGSGKTAFQLFNERVPEADPELRKAFDALLDAIEGADSHLDDDEFVDAQEVIEE
ncbi:ankyrin repeat-containing domain protein [Podospora aff. communis PSN243]|uniref:Ankyrin repeat-containing domain protein n=1 Tax=Podospora aff. communis PSN243 TaxID=3040156 RepID=A0AAV9G5S0_9PEZI|nr:ankyrin repeat-containing domain protein [Podospora aff. communis PSN243]